uniref:Cyclic AMP-dependent transcription factor ATF-7 n=1 Tax=Poecilia formosa TaxID=48698 RepID=A0A096MG38_POEFO
MNDKQDRPYVCGAPGCSQRFQLEEHLLIHRHKHEMTLKFPPIKTDRVMFSDQTPTPTRFLQNCEEVGLFKEIEEEFLQAQEEENNKQNTGTHYAMDAKVDLKQLGKLSIDENYQDLPSSSNTKTASSLKEILCNSKQIVILGVGREQSTATACSSAPHLPAAMPRSTSTAPTKHSEPPASPSPPSRLHQNSPPAPPLSAPPQVQCVNTKYTVSVGVAFVLSILQLSPVAQQMQPSHSQHAAQASCSGSSSSGGSGGGGGGGGGSRRRRSAEQDPDERRQKFLERNRAAATRCRQKRKLWVSSLEKKAEELTHTNLQLQNEVTSLRSEVGQLKQILLTHKDCPVTARQREAQGYPTAGVSPEGSPTPADPETQPHAIQHNSVSTSSTVGCDNGHGPLSGL